MCFYRHLSAGSQQEFQFVVKFQPVELFVLFSMSVNLSETFINRFVELFCNRDSFYLSQVASRNNVIEIILMGNFLAANNLLRKKTKNINSSSRLKSHLLPAEDFNLIQCFRVASLPPCLVLFFPHTLTWTISHLFSCFITLVTRELVREKCSERSRGKVAKF